MSCLRPSGFLGILALLFATAPAVIACSCAENPTVDRAFAGAKHVATLKAVAPLKDHAASNDPEATVPGFNFVVQTVFKGTGLRTGQELTLISGGMCSFGFVAGDLGREYLIYYYDDDRFGFAPLCTRSGALEWAAADIQYIEKVEQVRGSSRISGALMQVHKASSEGQRSRAIPLEGRSVVITGQGRRLRLTTDKDGVFEVYGLPAGSYRIEPEKLRGYIATDGILEKREAANVVLHSGGHVEADFNFHIDNSISGRLLGSDGKPLVRVRLDLVPAFSKPAKYFVESDYTDKDGKFRFERIPEGTYVIVGNKDNVVTAEYPYPRFYASGTDDRKSAPEINVGAGDRLTDFVVRASNPVAIVTISGVLRFADGSSVTTGTIKFLTGNGDIRLPSDSTAYVDKKGNFSLTVLKDQKGVIFGYVPLNTWVFRDCLNQVNAIRAETEQARLDFPETTRHPIESASSTTGLELKFPFTLCSER